MVVASGWPVLQMGQLIGRKGKCQTRLPLFRAECNVDNDLVPEARNDGQAPPDPCSGMRGSRRLPREARLGAPFKPAHSNRVCRARFCRKKWALTISYAHDGAFTQKISPGRARGLSSLSPAFLLHRLQNTPEAPRTCHFSAQAPQTDT